MKKFIIGFLLFILLATMIFYAGPRPQYESVNPQIDALSIPLSHLDSVIAYEESKVSFIKPNNEAKIIWVDSVRKTKYSLVYLHGFSASHHEGHPVHKTIAEKYGMNLYLARIYGHGVDTGEDFNDLTPVNMIESAKKAISVGNLIGDSTIVISCSTGGTYSIYLSAFNPDKIYAQILYSPNIEIFDPNAKLLTGPWGVQFGDMLLGEYREITSSMGTYKEEITTTKYKTQGLIALQALLDQTMNPEVFQKVSVPSMVGYYYKSDSAMDSVVSVEAMRNFIKASSIPENDIYEIAFENVGDHVLAGYYQSKDIPAVIEETSNFIENVLEIEPVIKQNAMEDEKN